MAAYSIGLRQKIVQAYERRLASQHALADVFGVSLSFIEKGLRRYRTTARWAQSSISWSRHSIPTAGLCIAAMPYVSLQTAMGKRNNLRQPALGGAPVNVSLAEAMCVCGYALLRLPARAGGGTRSVQAAAVRAWHTRCA
jgi:hypothetical protein